MDYTNLTTTQLTAVSNAFLQLDALLQDDLPAEFPDMLAEYLAMDGADRMQLQSEMAARANFQAYAESIGSEGIADALMKVADDLKDMSAKQLGAVKSGGIAGLAKLPLSK